MLCLCSKSDGNKRINPKNETENDVEMTATGDESDGSSDNAFRVLMQDLVMEFDLLSVCGGDNGGQ